jgi:2-polyprenyl-6-hydroxyphenyl methylase/3-demethylubiquinone-9 3-methyltransferase
MPEARKASVFLWFDSEAEDAARFYAETFPDSRIDNLVRPVNDVPGTKAGAVQIVEMTLLGIPYALLNAGPHTVPNDAYSLQVYTEDQAETDRYWDAIVGNGGEEVMCGWCKDKWAIAGRSRPAP